MALSETHFMRRLRTHLLCVLILPGLFGCGSLSPTQTTPATEHPKNTSTTIHTSEPQPTENLAVVPTLSALPEGWSQIDPGGNSSCARGGKYSFFVRKANSNKLLIYFEGGGACYDAKTCQVGAHYFDDSITATDQADNPALKTTGVFALNDERNPFKDYNIVFVSYCTGDAFMGNRVVSYTDGGKSFTVNQVGYLNTQSVLGWTYQNFAKPDSVFVIGCSAGVVGSFFHAPYMLEQYQNIPFALVGDSGGGYFDGPASVAKNLGTLEVLPDWLPQYQDLIVNDLIRSRLFFVIPAQAYPNARFGLLDTLNDSLQGELISRFNKKLTLAKVLQSNLDDIRVDAPDIYSYTGPGDYHCITMHPDFYTYEVGGTKLSDWLASLANGQPVENIMP